MAEEYDLGFREPITQTGDGAEKTRLLHGPNEFFHNYFKTLRKLDACLEKWLGVPLLFDEQEKAASLIFDISAPIFSLSSKQVDSARLQQSVEGLDTALSNLKRARRALASLPHPLDDRTLASTQRIEDQINHLTGVRVDLITMAKDHHHRSNQRAVRIAKVLRASFERYTTKRLTSSATMGTVTSEFCQALEEVFGIIRMTANAFNYAKIALNCPANDAELLEIKKALRERFDEENDYAVFFCEITRSYIEPTEWYHVDSIAEARSFEISERSQCKSLKTNVFTTMTTRSLISLLRDPSVHSGAIAVLDLLGSSSVDGSNTLDEI